MRYFLSILLVICSLYLLNPQASGDCSVTIVNCTVDTFDWCAYDSDSFWDEIVASSYDSMSSDSSDTATCGSSSSCYVAGTIQGSTGFGCPTGDVGTISCGDYACVENIDGDDSGDFSPSTGSDEFCCVDNACSTDCD